MENTKLQELLEEEYELQSRMLNGEYYLGNGDGKTILSRLGELALEIGKVWDE